MPCPERSSKPDQKFGAVTIFRISLSCRVVQVERSASGQAALPRRVVSEAAREALGVAQRAAGLVATALLRSLTLSKPTTTQESTMTETMFDLPGAIAKSDEAAFQRE